MDGLLEPEDTLQRRAALEAPWGELGRSLTLGSVALFSKMLLTVLNTVTVDGLEAYQRAVMQREEGTGLITVCNHTSTMDDPMLHCAMLPGWYFFTEHKHEGNRWVLCAKEICYKTRLLGHFFQSGKTLPIVRGQGLAQPIMQTVAEEVAHGGWLHLFPEGKVNYTGTLGPLRWGVGKVICDARLHGGKDPILLPFYHSGMGQVLPRKGRLPRTGTHVHVVVGQPLDISDLTCKCNQPGEDQRAVWRAITRRVQHALEDLEAGAPPNVDQLYGHLQPAADCGYR